MHVQKVMLSNIDIITVGQVKIKGLNSAQFV